MGAKGWTKSLESRRAQSARQLGTKQSSETRAKRSATMTGVSRPGMAWSQGTREKQKISRKRHIEDTTLSLSCACVIHKNKRGESRGKRSPLETNEKIRQWWINHLEDPTQDSHNCAPHILRRGGFNTKMTKIQKILISVLLAEFSEVIPAKHFGRFEVDAYLPAPYHLAFEADGKKWHTGEKYAQRDEKRDAVLWERFQLPVVRLTDDELNEMVTTWY